MSKCARCGTDPCVCGVHAFELGLLMGAVGCFLHGEADVVYLGQKYRELAARVVGQHCGGCDVCPPLTLAPAGVRS